MEALKINPVFKDIIPPLSKEEYEGLEQSIIAEGKIRDPIVIWKGTIVDGHNRYKIANKHELPYKTENMEFVDEDEVKLWIIDNQLNRRNVPPYVRLELAKLKEPLIKAEAEKRMLAGKADPLQVTGKGSKRVHTDKEVAKIAGVSHDTYTRAKKIMEKASPEIIQDLREGKRSIHETERELRIGSRICEVCGVEKPLSRFQNEGGKKCLDCKSKKVVVIEKVTEKGCKNEENEHLPPWENSVSINKLAEDDEASDVGDDVCEETDYEGDLADEAEETEESKEPAKPKESPKPTEPHTPQKLSTAAIALGINSNSLADYANVNRDEVRKTQESVRQMAEYSRNHKRTFEEFQQVFKANAERLVNVLEHQIKFMDAEVWADENNKKMACDLIDDVVQAVSNLRRNL